MRSPQIIPYHITFPKWAAQQSFLRPELFWPVPTFVKDWRNWALQVVFINQQTYPQIPIPSRHLYPNKEDWRHWAAQLIYILA
jgi:hypothetical protein